MNNYFRRVVFDEKWVKKNKCLRSRTWSSRTYTLNFCRLRRIVFWTPTLLHVIKIIFYVKYALFSSRSSYPKLLVISTWFTICVYVNWVRWMVCFCVSTCLIVWSVLVWHYWRLRTWLSSPSTWNFTFCFLSPPAWNLKHGKLKICEWTPGTSLHHTHWV